MEKNITVAELIEKFNEFNNENTKNTFLKNTIKTVNYMSTPMVDALATQIVNNSSFNDDGDINIDSFRRYILYIITLIEEYTNIKIDSSNAIIEYDNLVENDLVDRIINLIPVKCVQNLETAVKIKGDDIIMNYQLKRYDSISLIPEKIMHIATMLINDYVKEIGEIKKELNDMDNIDNIENDIESESEE